MGFVAQIRIYQMDEVGKNFKQRKQEQKCDDKNYYTIWGLLKMGKCKAQVTCRGWERKSRDPSPPGFYSTGGEESLKHFEWAGAWGRWGQVEGDVMGLVF